MAKTKSNSNPDLVGVKRLMSSLASYSSESLPEFTTRCFENLVKVIIDYLLFIWLYLSDISKSDMKAEGKACGKGYRSDSNPAYGCTFIPAS